MTTGRINQVMPMPCLAPAAWASARLALRLRDRNVSCATNVQQGIVARGRACVDLQAASETTPASRTNTCYTLGSETATSQTEVVLTQIPWPRLPRTCYVPCCAKKASTPNRQRSWPPSPHHDCERRNDGSCPAPCCVKSMIAAAPQVQVVQIAESKYKQIHPYKPLHSKQCKFICFSKVEAACRCEKNELRQRASCDM